MNKILFYLTMPIRMNYWYMAESYNKEWNEKFIKLVSENDFIIEDNYYAKLGDHTLWIENRPYACFEKQVRLTDNFYKHIRPSRYSIYLGLKKLKVAMKLLEQKSFKNI